MVGSGNLLNITRPLGMLHTELWMETTPTAHSLRRGGPDDATWNFCETSRLTFVLDPLGLFIFLSLEQLCGGKEMWVVVSYWLFSRWNITKIANRMYFPQIVGKVEAFHDCILPRSHGISSHLVLLTTAFNTFTVSSFKFTTSYLWS